MADPITHKKCSTCKKVRHVTLFQKDKTRRDGYRYDCSDCRNVAKYYQESTKKRRKHATKAKAKANSKRFFLEAGLWAWKSKTNELYKPRRYRRKRSTDPENRSETDDILEEFGL